MTKNDELKIAAAIKELSGYNHGFLPRDLVKELTAPFGFAGETYLEPASPQRLPGNDGRLLLLGACDPPIDSYGRHAMPCSTASA
jgi:hypothetical protein